MSSCQYLHLRLMTIVFIGLAIPSTVWAQAEQCLCGEIEVDAQANIFGAGHPEVGDPPAPGGGNDAPWGGIWPEEIQLPSGVNRVLAFVSVDGFTRPDGEQNPISIGPDGSTSRATGDTNICSFDGISGILYEDTETEPGNTMFLVGVFLDASEPDGLAPERLDFSADVETDLVNHRYGEAFLELSPQLRQIFFIGDGMTGTGEGERQIFHIPNGATRLFLGFADAYDFGQPENNDCDEQTGMCEDPPLPPGQSSCPGYYDDNDGALIADFVVFEEGEYEDCNFDGIPNICDPDCQNDGAGDGESDICQILEETSADCNGNWIPDECEDDCNKNGIPDDCDIAAGAPDCNNNEILDVCEIDEDSTAPGGPFFCVG